MQHGTFDHFPKKFDGLVQVLALATDLESAHQRGTERVTHQPALGAEDGRFQQCSAIGADSFQQFRFSETFVPFEKDIQLGDVACGFLDVVTDLSRRPSWAHPGAADQLGVGRKGERGLCASELGHFVQGLTDHGPQRGVGGVVEGQSEEVCGVVQVGRVVGQPVAITAESAEVVQYACGHFMAGRIVVEHKPLGFGIRIERFESFVPLIPEPSRFGVDHQERGEVGVVGWAQAQCSFGFLMRLLQAGQIRRSLHPAEERGGAQRGQSGTIGVIRRQQQDRLFQQVGGEGVKLGGIRLRGQLVELLGRENGIFDVPLYTREKTEPE